jgi:hypothetical protein
MISGFLSGFIVVVVISVIGWLITLFKKAKSLPQNFAARKVANSEAEEGLYDFIRQQIESGEIRSGLWTKAEATANSTENAAIRAKYIQLRFEQLEAQGQRNRIVNGGSKASGLKTAGTEDTSADVSSGLKTVTDRRARSIRPQRSEIPVKQYADLYRFSEEQVIGLIKNGQLKGRKVNNDWSVFVDTTTAVKDQRVIKSTQLHQKRSAIKSEISISDYAAIYRLSEEDVMSLIQTGRLNGRKVGGQWVVFTTA